MELDRRIYLYEVLVRYNKDGLAGQHAIDIEEVFDTKTGEVISAREFPARPIDKAEVGKVLGVANATAIEKLTAREDALREELKVREEQLAAARADIDAAIAGMKALVESLTGA